jgi:uncharacterized protein (UPF0332 family)
MEAAGKPEMAEGMSDLWTKADVAARSARLLLEQGDSNGAVNRAYFAAFSAARAALAAIRPSLALSKRHGTIIRRFSKYVVEERGFECSLGGDIFRRQRTARWAADYDDGGVDEATARMMTGEADRFLATVQPFLPAGGASDEH